MKVVINSCYGGFGLSDEAMVCYFDLKGWDIEIEDTGCSLGRYAYYVLDGDTREYFCSSDIDRSDKILVEVVELLGEKANGDFSKLKIVDIPDDIEWDIVEYDGREHIAEAHRTWS